MSSRFDMSKLAFRFVSCCLLSFFAGAQEVPKDLPSVAAINAYQGYLERPGYSAFAISRHGAYGASWSYGLIAAAESAAIEECEKMAPASPCFVVSVDGESLQETLDIKDLKGFFNDEQGRIWPAVEAERVPIQIARSQEQIQAYRLYTPLRGNKAFAASMEGVFGFSEGHINRYQAEEAALQKCRETATKASSCKIVDVNNQASVARITVAVEPSEPLAAPALPEIQSDNVTLQLAMRLLGDRWEEYQGAARNKAVAANQFGALGIADEHISALVAEEAALSTCETYNEMRRNTRYLANKVAPCVLVASNDYFDTEHLTTLLKSQESESVKSVVVGDYIQDWHGKYQLEVDDTKPASNEDSVYFLIGARGFQLYQGDSFRASGRYQRQDDKLMLNYDQGQGDPKQRALVFSKGGTALYFEGAPEQVMLKTSQL